MAVKRITDMAEADALTGDELLELSQLSTDVRITAATISAAAADNSFNDSADGFVAAGFAIGDRVSVSGFTGDVANNLVVGTITDLTAGKMTIGGTDGDVIVDDAEGESVTIAKWTSTRSSIQDLIDLASTAGLPAGGTTGQVLTKQSDDDGDADWETPSGGGGGGALSVDQVITLTAATGVEIPGLDFANYDYEFRFNARGTGRTATCSLRVQTGGTGGSPTWNTTANTWANHTGAISGSVSSGQIRVGYSGTVANGEPIVAKIEMRTSDDLRTMNGFYYFGPYESRGVMAQNTTADIGAVRFLLDNGVWTGKITVYKLARA